jgi:hypothetical protein
VNKTGRVFHFTGQWFEFFAHLRSGFSAEIRKSHSRQYCGFRSSQARRIPATYRRFAALLIDDTGQKSDLRNADAELPIIDRFVSGGAFMRLCGKACGRRAHARPPAPGPARMVACGGSASPTRLLIVMQYSRGFHLEYAAILGTQLICCWVFAGSRLTAIRPG